MAADFSFTPPPTGYIPFSAILSSGGVSGGSLIVDGGNISNHSSIMGIVDNSDSNNLYFVPLSNNSGHGNYSGERAVLPTYIWVWVTTANILVFLTGVLGNILVIVVVLFVRDMKTATNLCLMNLSIADLLVLLICQPAAMLEFFSKEIWLLGEAMCVSRTKWFVPVIIALSFVVSIYTLEDFEETMLRLLLFGKLVAFLENAVCVASMLIILTISLERFWAVYYPLKTYSSGSKSKAMISMGLVWLVAVVANSPHLIMARTFRLFHYAAKREVEVCASPMDMPWHKIYFVSRFCLVFVVSLVLIILVYSLIIKKVLHETMECKQMTESARTQSQQNRKQLVVMLIGVIILYFVCLLPFRIMVWYIAFSPRYLGEVLGEEQYLNLSHFLRLLIFINSAGNPIIYNIVSTKFRRAFQRVLRKYCHCLRCFRARLVTGVYVNGNQSHATRMTTMSPYSMVKQEGHDFSDSVDAV